MANSENGGAPTRTVGGKLVHEGPTMLDVEARTKILTLLLDVEAVASMLSISTRTVRRMADSGQMPRPLKVASLIRWRRTDLEQWLADGAPNCLPSDAEGRAMTGERYLITVEPLQGDSRPADVRLRQLLKIALRSCGLRCVAVTEKRADLPVQNRGAVR